jgi:hypothetical protein
MHRLGLGRGEFFLHLGRYSLGCITVQKDSTSAVQEWGKLKKLLDGDTDNTLKVSN